MIDWVQVSTDLEKERLRLLDRIAALETERDALRAACEACDKALSVAHFEPQTYPLLEVAVAALAREG